MIQIVFDLQAAFNDLQAAFNKFLERYQRMFRCPATPMIAGMISDSRITPINPAPININQLEYGSI